MNTKTTSRHQDDDLRQDKFTTIAFYVLLGSMGVGLLYIVGLLFVT